MVRLKLKTRSTEVYQYCHDLEVDKTGQENCLHGYATAAALDG
ncbi:hypothetical protein [Pelosinus sp. IPA-1]|nr:hypothetical protein [Pelosinus sp. IPA-1]